MSQKYETKDAAQQLESSTERVISKQSAWLSRPSVSNHNYHQKPTRQQTAQEVETELHLQVTTLVSAIRLNVTVGNHGAIMKQH